MYMNEYVVGYHHLDKDFLNKIVKQVLLSKNE